MTEDTGTETFTSDVAGLRAAAAHRKENPPPIVSSEPEPEDLPTVIDTSDDPKLKAAEERGEPITPRKAAAALSRARAAQAAEAEAFDKALGIESGTATSDGASAAASAAAEPAPQAAEQNAITDDQRKEAVKQATLRMATVAAEHRRITSEFQQAFPGIESAQDLEYLRHNDPEQYLSALAAVNNARMMASEVKTLANAVEQYQEGEFKTWAEKQDAEVAKRHPELAKNKAIYSEAVSLLKDVGLSDEEASDLYHGKRAISLRDSRMQSVLAAAAKYRLMEKSKTAVTAKSLPRVMRPGVARPQGAAAAEAIQALTNKLSQTGSLKDAQALRAAQMKAQRRAAQER